MKTKPMTAASAPAGDAASQLATPTLTRRQFVLRHLGLFGALTLGEATGEPNGIEVTQHRVRMPGLDCATRLVQLSDLHRSWSVSESYIQRIVARANALKPDVVALTGDFVTHTAYYAPSCANHLAKLCAPLGRYGVLGNHDYWCDDRRGVHNVSDRLEDAGITLLLNRSERLANGLRLVGVDDYWAGTPDVWVAFRKVRPGEPTIAMTHNPSLFPKMAHYDCVTLAGHTHGGQINIPCVSQRYMGRYASYLSGWYHHPGVPGRLYVSRGLGVVGIPLRFRANPEIAVFDLVPA